MTIRIGIIGAGRVAAVHADALASQPGVRVTAVADPRPGAAASMADRLGATPFDDVSPLLALRDVDAVDIAVPHDLHVTMAERAIAANKHVFMDKPLATDMAGADRIVSLASGSDRVFMVCHNLLFHPAVIRAGELIGSGSFGALRLCDAWSHGWLDLSPWDFRRSREATGGGAWIDNGPHLIYALEALAGEVATITAVPGIGPSRLGGEDSVAATAQFESGACGTMRVSYAIRSEITDKAWPAGWRFGFRIDGTDGYLELDLAAQSQPPVVRQRRSPLRRPCRYDISRLFPRCSPGVRRVDRRRPPTQRRRGRRQALLGFDAGCTKVLALDALTKHQVVTRLRLPQCRPR